MFMTRIVAIAFALAALAASPAMARNRHHRAAARGYAQRQGGAVAAATARSYRAPGLARELAPDAKQTATGGPVGGLPGRR